MCKHTISKFNSCSDEYLYNLSLECCNDEITICDTHYFRLNPPFIDLDNGEEVLYTDPFFGNTEREECVLKNKLNQYKGVIIEEVSDGFVTVKYYDNKHNFETDWDNILVEAEDDHEDYMENITKD